MRKVLIGAVALAIASCMQATTTITPSLAEDPPQTEPAIESEPEEEKPMKLQPIPAYPAYYREEAGSIYGIPADLQGMTQREKIDVLQDTGEAAPVTDFFIKGGVIYITAHYFTPPKKEGGVPVEHTEYFSQMLGSQTVNASDSIPEKPEPKHITANLKGFVIEKVGQVSEIWNKDKAFVSPQTPKGCGPFRYPMVSGYVEQDAGLLFATGDALLFIPANRTAPNLVSEAGRLWK